MRFLNQFQPASKAAYFALGFLFFYITRNFSYEIITLFALFLILILNYFRGYRIVCAFCIGFLLSCIHFFYFTKEIEVESHNNNNIEILNANGIWKIQFQKEIRRNFYETKFQSAEKEFILIVKRTKKDISLPTFLCDASNLFIKEVASSEEYFQFLKPFSYSYILLKERKCQRISEEINSKKLIRKRIEQILERSGITDHANDIAMGLFFGDASYLDNEFKEKVREGGVLHLFAASGLHIGVFIGFIYFFSKRIWFFNYYTERIFPLFLAFSYLYILDFPVSLLRAYIFTSLLILGSLFFRKMKSIDLILISSFLILLVDKESFLTLSFNLSYSAVCGILFLKKYLDDLIFLSKKNFLSENFTISISASLGTYPILVFYFKTFSFGSIFLNLILVPLTSLLLPLLYICLCFQILLNFLYTLYSQYSFNLSFQIHLFIESFLFSTTQYTLDILWTYSELLLRILAYLSECLSSRLGFYRSVKDSLPFHFGIYFALLLFLSIGFFILDLEEFAKKRKIRKRILLSIFYFLLIVSFFYFGFILFPEKHGYEPNFQYVSASSESYLVKENKQIYLGGTCKYNSFKIQKALKEKLCDETVEEIFMEDESCLPLALACKRKSIQSNLYSTKSFSEWEKKYSFLHSNSLASKRNFKNLLIYYPHLDSLSQLQKFSRESKENGRILLLFAYKLNDHAKDWNANKNLLGIKPNWNFITPDEL